LYETLRLALRHFWQSLIWFGSSALWVVVTVAVLVSCALLVYLGAVLLARLVMWYAYYP
jgi:Zn-dependent membrane protease YugP